MVNPKNCIFCKMSQGKVSVEKIKETNNFFAIKDANPKSEGHTLVIPKKHFVTFLDLNNNLGNEMVKLVKEIASELMDEKKGDGFNILVNNLGCAGQVVFHLHIHIIPRKDGDKIMSVLPN